MLEYNEKKTIHRITFIKYNAWNTMYMIQCINTMYIIQCMKYNVYNKMHEIQWI